MSDMTVRQSARSSATRAARGSTFTVEDLPPRRDPFWTWAIWFYFSAC